jgi:hypothetical protein
MLRRRPIHIQIQPPVRHPMAAQLEEFGTEGLPTVQVWGLMKCARVSF